MNKPPIRTHTKGATAEDARWAVVNGARTAREAQEKLEKAGRKSLYVAEALGSAAAQGEIVRVKPGVYAPVGKKA